MQIKDTFEQDAAAWLTEQYPSNTIQLLADNNVLTPEGMCLYVYRDEIESVKRLLAK
jgi:hypothetical protein